MKHLDRSRPFGVITPPHKGAHFEQDGHLFAADGSSLDPSADAPAERRKPGPKPKPREEHPVASVAQVNDQVAAQLEG